MCQDSVEAISQINQCDQDYSLRMSHSFHHGSIGYPLQGNFFRLKDSELIALQNMSNKLLWD